MPDPVTPALTAEEWEKVFPLHMLMLEVFVHDAANDVMQKYGIERERWSPRHALAALALHGQPFGFDREDISVLECASSFWPVGREWEAEVEKLRSIMARIAALLPPRGTEP